MDRFNCVRKRRENTLEGYHAGSIEVFHWVFLSFSFSVSGKPTPPSTARQSLRKTLGARDVSASTIVRAYRPSPQRRPSLSLLSTISSQERQAKAEGYGKRFPPGRAWSWDVRLPVADGDKRGSLACITTSFAGYSVCGPQSSTDSQFLPPVRQDFNINRGRLAVGSSLGPRWLAACVS